MDFKIKKTIKTIRNKISQKKQVIGTSDEIKTSVQDIFAQFLQKMYNIKLANYPDVKDLSYDYSEILILFFEEKNEKLLKKLIFALFIPFLYAEMSKKERKKAEEHVINLHKRLEKLRKELRSGKQPSISFRKVYLPKEENNEKGGDK